MSTYPIQAAVRAREHHEAGWGPTRIRQLLTDEGLGSPNETTILMWVHPSYGERKRERSKAAKRVELAEQATFRLPGSTDAYRERFVRELAQRGLDARSTAAVAGLVLRAPVDEAVVRRIVRGEPLAEDGPESETPVLDRIVALRDAGVSAASIAAVIALDQKVMLTPHQVRYALRTMREPRHAIRRSAERAA